MKTLLTTSIALLLSQLAFADDAIPAQPITTSATAGNEQSDFFITRAKATDSYKLVFSANLKTTAPKHGNPTDQRALFSQRVEGLDKDFELVTYFLVNKSAPLAKLSAYTVPAGTAFDNFLVNPTGLQETFFRIPTKGLYVSTGGATPILVRVGSTNPAKDVTGAALEHPGNTAGNTDRSLQFRVVLGTHDPHKGNEPFISQGPARTTVLLSDLVLGAGSSNPRSFTTFLDVNDMNPDHAVGYFVADDATGATNLYRTTVNPSVKPAKYSAATVASGLGAESFAIGGPQTLLYVDAAAGVAGTLHATHNGTGVVTVSGGGTDPEQLVPDIDESSDDAGYSSIDTSERRRFTKYFGFDDSAAFTDSSATVTDPTNITSAGDYYFYGATVGGSTRVCRDGGQGPVYLKDPTGALLTNLREIRLVATNDLAGQTLYFVADVVGGASDQLFVIDPTDTVTEATLVTTINNHPVVGAHNLRSVGNDQGVLRLYFTAPINTIQNTEYLPLDNHGNPVKPDIGTKPFVTNQGT